MKVQGGLIETNTKPNGSKGNMVDTHTPMKNTKLTITAEKTVQ